MRRSSLITAASALGVALTLGLSLTACGSGGGGSSSGSSGSASGATSAAGAGGMDALVAAAKKEGTLNVIALPRDWANYGTILDTFAQKYGLKINSVTPEGSSQDELNAVTSQKGQGRAPDVLDVGTNFAYQAKAQGLLADYQVATWADIPADQKDAQGAWYNDYGGYISIGCDAKKVGTCPKTFADLLKPDYKGKVALNGNPTQAAAAFAGVWGASLANGGSLDNIGKGIDFFGKVKQTGNWNPVEITPATVLSPRSPGSTARRRPSAQRSAAPGSGTSPSR